MQLEARINGATEQKGEPLGCESRGERQLPFAVPLWMAPLPRSEGTFELRTSKDLDRICKRINQTHARGNAKNGFPRCCPAELDALRFRYAPVVRSCRRRRAERERYVEEIRSCDASMPANYGAISREHTVCVQTRFMLRVRLDSPYLLPGLRKICR